MTLDVVDGTIPMGITFLSSLKVRDSTSNVNSEYTFYADGTPWSLKHSTGDSSFVMLSWYESGDLKSRSYYERNKLVSSDLWHDNGQKMRDVNLVDGKRQGHAIWYNENGTKSAEGYYKNDEQVGKWKFYDKNGKLTRIKEM